jgi:hypothetical protein
MKTINTILLTITFAMIANILFAQSPVKQYCGGTNGSISNPSNALGNDLSDFSTLKLKTTNAKKDNVYQNFIFNPATTKGTRVSFVIQTDLNFDPTNVRDLNFKFYTSSSDGIFADTVATENVQITLLNETSNLYEFSFVSENNFDTAGMMLQGGGIFKTAKIYQVSLAINQVKITSANFISARK